MRLDHWRSIWFEGLESRRLLTACEIDPQPGDANLDCFVDIADWLQIAKFGKRRGDPATWEEGDWNGDGIHDADDLSLVFHDGWFERGLYDDRGTAAMNELKPISRFRPADASLYYFPESGGTAVVVEGNIGIRALHIVSKSSSIIDERGPRIFDRSSESFQLVNSRQTPGAKMIEFIQLLPAGWTDEQVLDDLLIDGAIVGGGELGNVRLGDPDEFPVDFVEEWPEARIQVPDRPTFADADEANGLLTYDPATGDILIESWGLPIYQVQLKSPAGLLVGTTLSDANRYDPHLFDEANPNLFNRIALDANVEFVDGVPQVDTFSIPGFQTVNLPEIAERGLTEAEFLEDIQPEGVLDPSGRLQLAFVIGPTFGLCREIKEHGTIMGDANQDGRFDSQDLVTVFQSNEYRDDLEDNSTWSEGDWTCDGDFDTDDLVAAFQSGQYEQAAAAIVRVDLDRRRSTEASHHDGKAIDSTANRTLRSLSTTRRSFAEFELGPVRQAEFDSKPRSNERSMMHNEGMETELVDSAHVDGDEFFLLE